MPSRRGYIVFAAGVGLWIAARLVGSPDLHVVAVGVALLPLTAGAFARWSRARLGVNRRLSATRVAPGQRVRVELEVENRSPATTSFILLEDQVPSALGRPARLVLTGLPARNSQRVAYTVLCRTRGRYHLGPLRIDISDPFALTKLRMEYTERDELVVFPEVEELRAVISSQFGSGAGESTSRHLFRTGEEFFTMREYQVGDDLRRIHWPSVARRGRLMIRQDESARRRSNAACRPRHRSASTCRAADTDCAWRRGRAGHWPCRRRDSSRPWRRSCTRRLGPWGRCCCSSARPPWRTARSLW
jgi:uncharacterized protein (DUF58 family)